MGITNTQTLFCRRSLLISFAAASLSIATPALSVEGSSAEPSTASSTSSALTGLQNFTNRASEILLHAISLLGIRYQYGGNTPEKGLDCSGLVRYVFKEAWGASLPRTSEEMSRLGERVDTQDLQPGDLVFYDTLKRTFSHVGIYLGNNQFIHSPSSGGQVRIDNMDAGYWKRRFSGARRISETPSD